MTIPTGPSDQGVIVPTDANGGRMNAGVAPTTPSTVDDNRISPNTTVTAPPSGQPTGTNQPTPANGSPATTPQPQPVQPHPVSRLFDGILRNLSGPITVTDPATGERRDVPQTRGTMAKSILAAALSGLMTPNSYRETPYGPVNDVGGNIAAGAKAGQEFQEKRQAAAQTLTNQQQAVKLMTLTNNAKLVQLQAASAHMKHVALQDNLQNAQTFLTPFQEYEKVRTPDQPTAFTAQGLTADEVVAPGSGHKLTDSNVVLDGGVIQKYNEQTKQMEEEPTYAVLNPALGDMALPKEVTDKLAEMNSQWKDIHKIVGGNVRVPVNAYVSAMHDYQAVSQGENVLNTLAQEIGAKNKTINLASAVRANKNILPALYQLTQAGAGGNTVDNRPDNLLDTILKAPNGADLLKLIGISPAEASDKIQDIANDRLRKATLAKTGGIGDKAIAPPQMVNELTASASRLPKDQRDAIMAGVNPNGLTVGEAENLKNKILDSVNKNREFAANNPTPGTALKVPDSFVASPETMSLDTPSLQKELQSKGVQIPSDFAALYKVAHNGAALNSFPSTRRRGVNQMTQSEALSYIQNFINPAYQESDYSAAQGLNKELASTKVGTAGGSLLAAGTAANHLELLDQAVTALNNRDVQALNKAANYLGVQIGNTPAVTFKAVADQVNQEVGKVLAGGGATHQAELDKLNENLNTNQSPSQVHGVIRSYIGLMNGRMGEINERSQQYFGRDVKGISPTAAATFAKYGYAAPGYVMAQLPGNPPMVLSKAQFAAAKAKYPNIIVTAGGQ